MHLSGGLKPQCASGRQNRPIGHGFRVLASGISSFLSALFCAFRSKKFIRRFRPRPPSPALDGDAWQVVEYKE